MHCCPFGPLLSLKGVSSSFVAIPVSLNGFRRISKSSTDREILANGLLLDMHATREKHDKTIPDIMPLNFTNFASKYKMVGKKLTCHSDDFVYRVFPVILDCHFALWSRIK